MTARYSRGGIQYLTRTIWIWVALFAVQAVLCRHHSTLLFWTCAAIFALLLAPAIYFTMRRMMGRLSEQR